MIDDLPVEISHYGPPTPDFLYVAIPEAGSRKSLVSHLLKSNCPVTGQPDWASAADPLRRPAHRPRRPAALPGLLPRAQRLPRTLRRTHLHGHPERCAPTGWRCTRATRAAAAWTSIPSARRRACRCRATRAPPPVADRCRRDDAGPLRQNRRLPPTEPRMRLVALTALMALALVACTRGPRRRRPRRPPKPASGQAATLPPKPTSRPANRRRRRCRPATTASSRRTGHERGCGGPRACRRRRRSRRAIRSTPRCRASAAAMGSRCRRAGRRRRHRSRPRPGSACRRPADGGLVRFSPARAVAGRAYTVEVAINDRVVRDAQRSASSVDRGSGSCPPARCPTAASRDDACDPSLQRCGACCAAFRVAFHWSEAQPANPDGVPQRASTAAPARTRAAPHPAVAMRCVALDRHGRHRTSLHDLANAGRRPAAHSAPPGNTARRARSATARARSTGCLR